MTLPLTPPTDVTPEQIAEAVKNLRTLRAFTVASADRICNEAADLIEALAAQLAEAQEKISALEMRDEAWGLYVRDAEAAAASARETALEEAAIAVEGIAYVRGTDPDPVSTVNRMLQTAARIVRALKHFATPAPAAADVKRDAFVRDVALGTMTRLVANYESQADQIGDSDLDNEQSIAITWRGQLGDVRRARTAISFMREQAAPPTAREGDR